MGIYPKEIKSLIIDHALYAKYYVDADTLFMNVFLNVMDYKLRPYIPDFDIVNESILIKIISAIEKREFKFAGYLNLDAIQQSATTP